jgi:hypothetical protein
MTSSNVASPRRKPRKPRKDYPLYAHANGQWAKRVRGKTYFFGTWSDPRAAEKKWDRDKNALLDGRNPGESRNGDDVGWLCNIFLDSRQLRYEDGAVAKRTIDDYHRAAKRIVKFFGRGYRLDPLHAMDFEHYRNSLPKTWGSTTLDNHLRLCRAIFKYANDAELSTRRICYSIGLSLFRKLSKEKSRQLSQQRN